MNDPSLNPSSQQELETRITAVVLGEASDFERDQIDRLIEQRPDLAAMKARFESVHRLLHDVGQEEWAGVDEGEWKLPTKKRAALLDVLAQEGNKVRSSEEPGGLRRAAKISRFTKIGALVCAACLLVALGVWKLAVPRQMASVRSVVQSAPDIQAGTSIEYEKAFDVPAAALKRPGDSMSSSKSMGGIGGGMGATESDLGLLMGLDDMDTDEMNLGRAMERNAVDQPFAAAPRPSVPKSPSDAKNLRTLSEESIVDGERKTVELSKAGQSHFGASAGNSLGDALPSPYHLQDEVQYSPVPPMAAEPRQGAEFRNSNVQQDYADRAARRASEHFSFQDASSWEGLSRRRKSSLLESAENENAPEISVETKKSTNIPLGVDFTPESDAAVEPFSTFSLHVSDVSFKLAAAALAQGQWPETASVRIEEFVNALDFGDPLPSQHEKVACQIEQCIDPFVQQRNLLRVSLRTAAAGRDSTTPLRLTLLLDNSGSMERIDRQQTVRRAFETLTQQLQPADQVTLISFARTPRLVADRVSGARAKELVQLVENLPRDGGTNIEAALQLAWEKAREQRTEGAQNRIILLTDGAVNLGDANPERLSKMVASIRDTGIAFDAAGISANGLNDEVLEALTRKGDGRYYLLDSAESADAGFARQIAGALRPAAMNVKVQIEFNPQRVGHYRLLGFEKHRLNKEDFRNDKVDAAEMAAAEAGVAVYQFEAKPDGEGDVGSVSVRFRDMSTGQMVERRWPILYQLNPPRVDQAPMSMRLATVAAMFAAKLGGGPLGETVDLKTLSELLAGLPPQDRVATRIRQLEQMIQKARQISGG